jgi:hypothetical protein
MRWVVQDGQVVARLAGGRGRWAGPLDQAAAPDGGRRRRGRRRAARLGRRDQEGPLWRAGPERRRDLERSLFPSAEARWGGPRGRPPVRRRTRRRWARVVDDLVPGRVRRTERTHRPRDGGQRAAPAPPRVPVRRRPTKAPGQPTLPRAPPAPSQAPGRPPPEPDRPVSPGPPQRPRPAHLRPGDPAHLVRGPGRPSARDLGRPSAPGPGGPWGPEERAAPPQAPAAVTPRPRGWDQPPRAARLAPGDRVRGALARGWGRSFGPRKLPRAAPRTGVGPSLSGRGRFRDSRPQPGKGPIPPTAAEG